MGLEQLSTKDLEARVKDQKDKFWKIIKFVETTTRKLGDETYREINPNWIHSTYELAQFHGFYFNYDGKGYPRGDTVSINYNGDEVLHIDASDWRDEHWPLHVRYTPGKWEEKLMDIIQHKQKYFEQYKKQLKAATLEAKRLAEKRSAERQNALKKQNLLEQAKKLGITKA